MALAHARVLRTVLNAVENGEGVTLDTDDTRILVEYIASKHITPASEALSSIEGDVLDAASGELADTVNEVARDVRTAIAAARPRRPVIPPPTSADALEAVLDEADAKAAESKGRVLRAVHNHAMLESALAMLIEHADKSAAKNFVTIQIAGVIAPFDRATLALHRPGTKSGEELVVERDAEIARLQEELHKVRMANASLAGDVAEDIWRTQEDYGQVFRLAHDLLMRTYEGGFASDPEDRFLFPEWMSLEAMRKVIVEVAREPHGQVDTEESVSTADVIGAVARLLWQPDPPVLEETVLPPIAKPVDTTATTLDGEETK